MKLNDLKREVGTDPKKEAEGVWSGMDGEYGGIELLMGRMGPNNPRYARILKNLSKPIRQKIASGRIDDDEANKLLMSAFCQGVIFDWRNYEDDEGNPVPFTPDAAFALFSHPELRDAYERAKKRAEDDADYRFASLEVEAGN